MAVLRHCSPPRAATCSDDNSGGVDRGVGRDRGAAEVPDNSGTTVNLAVSPWVGSEANAERGAKSCCEDKLGYTVELTKIDEYAQFPALANGDLDATLEVWPSGHAKDYKKYIEADNGVVDGGELASTGQIGWWIPTYMLDGPPRARDVGGAEGRRRHVRDRRER